MNKINNVFPDLKSIYTRHGTVQMDEKQRVVMTTSCSDVDYISKVNGAGEIFESEDGVRVQRMHNGILVEAEGYYGKWMSEIILKLRGHHEPQEEKVFYEVLKRIEDGGIMIELGAHWAFYSLWFNKEIKDAINFCFEPDPNYLEGGKRNAKLNNAHLNFRQAAITNKDKASLEFSPETLPDKKIIIPCISVDDIVKQHQLQKIDILHMDIQGSELDALQGAVSSIEQKMIRFIFISTHHHATPSISLVDPCIHKQCIQFLKERGANIVAAHTVHESYSVDGLIVASFGKDDANFKVEISRNQSGNGFFVETEEDLRELSQAYSDLRDEYYKLIARSDVSSKCE